MVAISYIFCAVDRILVRECMCVCVLGLKPKAMSILGLLLTMPSPFCGSCFRNNLEASYRELIAFRTWWNPFSWKNPSHSDTFLTTPQTYVAGTVFS